MIEIQENFKCDQHKENPCSFVSGNYSKKNRSGIFQIILETNKKMKKKGYPGASARLVGSSKRQMTFIKSIKDKSFDHDIQNIYNSTKNPINEKEKTKKLRDDFIECLKSSFPRSNGYNWNVENSTSAITIIKSKNSIQEASFDIALINSINKKMEIHKFDKISNVSIWNNLAYFDKIKSINQIKDINKILNIKREYLKLKCNQKVIDKSHDDYKSSSVLLQEAINNVLNN